MGIAAMITLHRWLGSWREKVDIFIAPTKSAGLLLASGGVPMERLRIRPNFLPADPGGRTGGGDFALFVGRLSSEKGLAVLLDAWRSLPHIPLKIVGAGPLGVTIARRLARENLTSVEVLGRLPHEDVLRLMKSARMLVVPSVWYEVFALTIVEAFACGLPVVGSDIGSVGEIVEHGRTGRLFAVGNAEALALEAGGMWSDSQEARRMGAEARRTFLDRYTGERIYPQVQAIYDEARSHPSKVGARRRDEITERGSRA
jgi:glycosyltransferase involved in cell wall biosynthesis